MTGPKHTIAPRSLPYKAPVTLALIVLATAFFALGMRGILLPSAGAATLGIPASGGDALSLMQTTAARNIGLSLLAMSMIVFDQRRALAALLFAAALISILDFLIVLQASGLTKSVKHLAYCVLLGGFAVLTFRTPLRGVASRSPARSEGQGDTPATSRKL